jgi:rhodanese-related sulfurtransferase
VKRLVLQMLAIAVAAVAAGFGSNAVRAKLDLRSTDPVLLKMQAQNNAQGISLDDAAQALHQATTLFLDARATEDYHVGHIRGALSFPSEDADGAYAEVRDFLGPDVRAVVYSDHTLQAVRAAEYLTSRGHLAVVMDGGWPRWQERQLPVEGGETP